MSLLCIQEFVWDPVFSHSATSSQRRVSRCYLRLLLFLIASQAASWMPRGHNWRASYRVKLLEIWRRASKRHLISIVSSKIRANNGMLWALCGRHLVNLPHNTVSVYHHVWKRGRLIMCPFLLHPQGCWSEPTPFVSRKRKKESAPEPSQYDASVWGFKSFCPFTKTCCGRRSHCCFCIGISVSPCKS